MKYPSTINDPYGLGPNNHLGQSNKKASSTPEPEVYMVDNFVLEYESTTNDFIRWFKQTQPNHNDYQFEIIIKAIPRDNK